MDKQQRQQKIQELLNRLDSLQRSRGRVPTGETVTQAVSQLLNEEAAKVVSPIETGTGKALALLSNEVEQVMKTHDERVVDLTGRLSQVQDAMTIADQNNRTTLESVTNDFKNALVSLKQEVDAAAAKGTTETTNINLKVVQTVADMTQRLDEAKATATTQDQNILAEVEKVRSGLASFAREIDQKIAASITPGLTKAEAAEKAAAEVKSNLDSAVERFNRQLSNLGGGNANRSITVNSNSSTLSYYTDLNIKAGNNVTLTATPNHTTKYTDLTIAASGGAGGNPAGSDTQVQFNDNGSFGATDGLTFNKNTSVLTASIISATTEKLTVPDTSAVRGLDITNNAQVAALRITQVGSIAASRSVGGALLVSNGTTNTGNAAVFYSNVASAAGRIVHITADNVSFDKEALYVESDSTSTTALGVIGAPKGQGVIKVTHTGQADGSDANGAGISIDIAGAGTAAQGLFINATSSTTGNLLVARNAGANKFVVAPDGKVTVNNAYTLPTADGNANFVMTTDGSGNLSFASVAATGGSGITRQTSIITANTTGGNGASTDYVYVATGALSFTLPNPSGNTNLYTLKNASQSSVLVTAVGGKTIDGSGSVISAINNQSLDFISDGTNYRII